MHLMHHDKLQLDLQIASEMAIRPIWTNSMLLIAVAATLLTMDPIDGATIDIVNRCNITITACAYSGGTTNFCYVLNGNAGNASINGWEDVSIWGYPDSSGDPDLGTVSRFQANVAQFGIGGSLNEDTYSISNVDAYNLPMRINVTIAPGDAPSEQHCQPILCSIKNLTAFCQPPNSLTGPPGEGCNNLDGAYETRPTASTTPFKKACPSAYSYTADDTTSKFTCRTGSNYQVTFCPHVTDAATIQQKVSPASSGRIIFSQLVW